MFTNTKKLIFIATIIFIFGIGAYFFFQKSPSVVSEVDNKSIVQQGGVKDDENITDSRYAEYSKSAFEGTSAKRRVLFFYASWCPTCRPADASFRAGMNEIPEDTVVIRVNYNDPDTDSEEKELARKYGITYQHTFVQIDSAGNEVTKWNGGQLSELLSKSK